MGEQRTLAADGVGLGSMPLSGALAESELVAGRYEIVGLLGSGGMGTVYKARDRELEETVALKVLRGELVASPSMLERFKREVKLARRVTHPNVARTYDIGAHPGGRFLTMEFVDGEPLGAVLRKRGRLCLGRVAQILAAVCRGLAAAHEAGIIHRDLKPENVMLQPDGRVVITDFGIARFYDEGRAPTVETAFVGTPTYMAPEQVEGAQDIDPRADIYAVGAMMFELLTGQAPWQGGSLFSVAAARLNAPPPDPRRLRPELCDEAASIVLRCMARDRSERFQSAAEVAAALDVQAGTTIPPDTLAPHTTTRSVRSFAPAPSTWADSSPQKKSAGPKTVAVLPFRNRGKPDDGYIAEGLTEDLIDTLCMTPSLKLRPYSAVADYAGRAVDAREVGRELGVQVVVEGSVQRAGERVRITSRLLTTEDGFQLWAKRFGVTMNELLEVSDEVASAIAERLTVELDAAQRKAPTDPRAMELYLRGRAALRRVWLPGTLEAVELFEQAATLAPTDPMILGAYARARARLWFWTDAPSDGAKAREAADRAMAAAPESADACLASANVSFIANEHAEAVALLRCALKKSPSQAEARLLLGRVLLEVGHIEEGLAQLRAAGVLDSGLAHPAEIARGLALLRRWDEVVELLTPSEGKQLVPGVGILCARLTLWSPELERLLPLVPPPESIPEGPREYVGAILSMFAGGRELGAEAREVLASRTRMKGRAGRLRILTNQMAAEACAWAGEPDNALGFVEAALKLGLVDIGWLANCAALDPLREEPRFVAALAALDERLRGVWETLGRPPS